MAAIIEQASPEELPGLIGELEAAKATAWQRINAAPSVRNDGSSREQNQNITVAEAAERLSVSRDWIYKNADKLPFTRRIGRRVVVSVAELGRYLKRRRSR